VPYTRNSLQFLLAAEESDIQGKSEFRYYLACSKGVWEPKLRRDLTKGEMK